MSNRSTSVIATSILTAGLALAAVSASAGEPAGERWREAHPRRAEVNARLAHQQARIHEEVREGDLTRAQGAQLSRQDHAIRQQERRMTANQGGHITARQQARLNREENAVSREIPR
jgi:hypothetical protein